MSADAANTNGAHTNGAHTNGAHINGDVDMSPTATTEDELTPKPVKEDEPLNLIPYLGRRLEQRPEHFDVAVVGSGPAGLMLSTTLARFGIRPLIIDERPGPTNVGRADGMQPKTIETLKMLGIADELLQQGVKIYDICLWRDSQDEPLRRMGRETHFPAFIVDLVEPFILIGHQGMVEKVFNADLAQRGIGIQRAHLFDKCTVEKDGPIEIECRFNVTQDLKTFEADYLVGCDGAHSKVRKTVLPNASDTDPGGRNEGENTSVWGVLDGEVDTDFPDIWSKSVVFSEIFGSMLIVPRERDQTRFYIEMKPSATDAEHNQTPQKLVQGFVMERAARILHPYHIRWRTVEWFGHYRVAQRVADKFADDSLRVFIAGDAAHTHSPKAAQGMNTSMHDGWNLGWKLNFAVRGLAKPSLMQSYEDERRKIAKDLIEFDYEHANQFSAGNVQELAENFMKNVRFISGVGVVYGANAINKGLENVQGAAIPGCNLPPGKVSRYIDANPVDIQLDMPVLGQFRVYIFVPDIVEPKQAHFLDSLCNLITAPTSLMSRLSGAAYQTYLKRPRLPASDDIFIRPERYLMVSQIFAFALITATKKHHFELESLPAILAKSQWTIYLDDVADIDTQGRGCIDKYLGGLEQGEVAIINVRPDGYVGSIGRFTADAKAGEEAARWLDEYYDGFLQVP